MSSGQGSSRAAMAAPLRQRNFALLWTGTAISMIGDGVYLVAIAWQVLSLAGTATALALVAVAYAIPNSLSLLAGGVLSDRYRHRHIMIASDVARAVIVSAIAVLSVTRELTMLRLVTLVIIFGICDGVYAPAYAAIVPRLLPEGDRTAANSLTQLARTVTLRLAGPALGGVLVAADLGKAFSIDAATFVASAALTVAIRIPADRDRASGPQTSALAAVREGLGYVLANRWLWTMLGAVALALFAYQGPMQVLLPVLLRTHLGGGARTFGALLGAQGAGAGIAALALAAGKIRPGVRLMFCGYAGGCLSLVVLGLASALWQALAVGVASGAVLTVATVTGVTLIQDKVPGNLMGRVASLNWLTSVSLLPLSYACAAPIASLVGVQGTFLLAGLAGAAAVTLFYLLGRRPAANIDLAGSRVPNSFVIYMNEREQRS
jgi:MFS family permease